MTLRQYFARSEPHQGNGTVITGFAYGPDFSFITVCFTDLNDKAVADFFPQNLLPEGGFTADETLAGIGAHSADDADGFHIVILRQIDIDLVEESDTVVAGVILYDDGGLDHALQITDAAAVFVLCLFGGFIFKVLA